MNFSAFAFNLDDTLFRRNNRLLQYFRQTFEQLKKAGAYAGDLQRKGEPSLLAERTTYHSITCLEKLFPDASDEAKASADQWLFDAEFSLFEKRWENRIPVLRKPLDSWIRKACNCILHSMVEKIM